MLVNTAAGKVSDVIAQGAEVIHLDIARDIAPFRDLKTVYALMRIFNARQFDMVHSVTPKAGLLAMLAARMTGIKLRVHTFTGQVWVTRRGGMRWLLRALDRLLAWCATALLVDSASQREFLVVEKIAPLESLHVLGEGSITGVDNERFSPNAAMRHAVRQDLKLPEDAVILLCVGRMHPDKGIAGLVRSFVRVTANFQHVHLLLVGPDEGDLMPALAGAGAFGDRIHTAGLTHQPEMYMAAADIYCLASYREGFGLSIVEAASCGLPCIAYKIYGVTDAVVDGLTGYLVGLGDENAFAGAMTVLLQNPANRLEMGREARKRATQVFSQHSLVQAWLDFYADQFAVKHIRSN